MIVLHRPASTIQLLTAVLDSPGRHWRHLACPAAVSVPSVELFLPLAYTYVFSALQSGAQNTWLVTPPPPHGLMVALLPRWGTARGMFNLSLRQGSHVEQASTIKGSLSLNAKLFHTLPLKGFPFFSSIWTANL